MRYTSVTVSRNATTLPVTTHASALTVTPRSGRTVSVRPVLRQRNLCRHCFHKSFPFSKRQYKIKKKVINQSVQVSGLSNFLLLVIGAIFFSLEL